LIRRICLIYIDNSYGNGLFTNFRDAFVKKGGAVSSAIKYPSMTTYRDYDFKAKLERQQTARNNIVATSNIRGGQGQSQAKNTPEYWIAKGVPPTSADIPDRKTRAKIARAMMANTSTGGKKFYNE
jgi:hypothetical protein